MNAQTNPIERSEFLSLYKNTLDEERFFIEEHQKQVAFYTGITTALIGLSGAGMIKSDHWLTFATLCLGPACIFVVSQLAIGSAHRFRRRFLVAISTRKKLEFLLGLNEPIPSLGFWQNEGVAYPGHVGAQGTNSSEQFVEVETYKGQHHQAVSLFRAFQLVAVLFFILLAGRSLMEYLAT